MSLTWGAADGRREKESTTETFTVAKEMAVWVPPPGSAWGLRLGRRNLRRAAAQQLKGDTNNFKVNCVRSWYRTGRL